MHVVELAHPFVSSFSSFLLVPSILLKKSMAAILSILLKESMAAILSILLKESLDFTVK